MTTMTPPRPLVTGGVDTHRDLHVAAALDPTGGVLGTAAATAAEVASSWPSGPPLLTRTGCRTRPGTDRQGCWIGVFSRPV